MSERAGEKTEQATPKRLEEALTKGQFARSPEIQSVFVLCAGMMAIRMAGPEAWDRMLLAFAGIFQNLDKVSLTDQNLQRYAIQSAMMFSIITGPFVGATVVSALLAGGIQSRFQTASEALNPDWERVNPLAGFKRIFSPSTLIPTSLSFLKLAVIGVVSGFEVKNILDDPIFYTAIGPAGIALFLAESSFKLSGRVIMVVMAIAAADYGYRYWKNNRDLMMTKQEITDEAKNSDGDPHMKARRRRRRTQKTQRQMLTEVPQADVVLTNPTHLAIALRYDRKSMKAPRIVAKGSRLNALKIRELAAQHQIPILENKPLARMLFKYGRVGGEVPAELYAAVAEVLAWVYRVNRFRYYSDQGQK